MSDNVKINDPGQKQFDGVSDPQGNIRDIAKAKKEGVQELVAMLQGTVNSHLSSAVFSSKFDLSYEAIYSVRNYVQGLEKAATTIIEAYPDGSEDNADLGEVVDICRALDLGCNRVQEYLDACSVFGKDLDKMAGELHVLTQKLFQGD